MNAVLALLRLEWLQTRRNRLVIPLYVLFPLIGVSLPSLMILWSSTLLIWIQRGDVPGLDSVLVMIQSLATMAQVDLVEAMRQLLLRSSAAYYVLLPTLILPITAAFAVVGERQRGSLEALLVTPISSAQFCIGKLLGTVLPAVLITWVAALLGALLAALLVHANHDVWMWPDLIWYLGVLLLTPLLAMLVSLVCLWVSIRARDAQAATQMSALVLMPVLLLLLVVLGPQMLLDVRVILWASLIIAGIDVLLLFKVLRVFGRDGLLGTG